MRGEPNSAGKSFSDHELVFQIQEGDHSAFSVLAQRYMPILQRRAARYSNIVGVDVEDFVQEGLLALFKAVKSYNLQAGIQFNTYAITCIHNSLVNAIRVHMKNLRQHAVPLSDLDEHRYQSAALREKPVEDVYLDMEASSLRARQMETLLSDFEQQVLKMYLSGHTYQQSANVLSTSTKAVDNALQRVRRKLRLDV